MKSFLSWLLLGVLFAGAGLQAESKVKEETIFLFENRKVTVAVPEGCGISSDKDEEGTMLVRIADPKKRVSAEIVFAPDPERRFSRAVERQEKLVELFQGVVADSVQKAMQFEELEPAVGGGTYCVFTDAKLAGEKKIPDGEYLHFTTGMKWWPGVVAVFRVFTNDTAAKEYKAVMTMLRESVAEKP